MSVPTVEGHDLISANVHNAPPGQLAGYTTGTPDIQWTETQFNDHPGTVRICQDSGATDHTADVADVEQGAVTAAAAVAWAKEASVNFVKVAREGQREPCIYCSQSNVTPVVNALISGGITRGINLWVANWSLTMSEAISLVANASGPFPIVAVQYNNTGPGPSDSDIFSKTWLDNVASNSKGPFWHAANGAESLFGIANARGTTVAELIETTLSAPGITEAHKQEMLNYANPEQGHLPMWRGTVYYTQSP